MSQQHDTVVHSKYTRKNASSTGLRRLERLHVLVQVMLLDDHAVPTPPWCVLFITSSEHYTSHVLRALQTTTCCTVDRSMPLPCFVRISDDNLLRMDRGGDKAVLAIVPLDCGAHGDGVRRLDVAPTFDPDAFAALKYDEPAPDGV